MIVAWHPDRLHRSPRELEDFIDLLEATGVTVATVTAGDRDFATVDGRFMARMEGTVARRESEHKSERIRGKHIQLAEKGNHVAAGGRRPFGYIQVPKTATRRAGLKIDPAEAKLIKEAARRVKAGESLYAVVGDWNDRGIPTVTGASWSTKTLMQILTKGRIAGWRDHHGQPVTKTDEWPAIIDEKTWRQLRAILLDPSRKRTRVARSYLLGPDQIRCGLCGGPMVASPQRYGAAQGYRVVPGYACRKEKGGCGRIRVNAEPVEKLVSEWTLDALADEDRVAQLRGAADDEAERAVRDQIADLEETLAQLSADHYQLKLISREEFLHNREPLDPPPGRRQGQPGYHHPPSPRRCAGRGGQHPQGVGGPGPRSPAGADRSGRGVGNHQPGHQGRQRLRCRQSRPQLALDIRNTAS